MIKKLSLIELQMSVFEIQISIKIRDICSFYIKVSVFKINRSA